MSHHNPELYPEYNTLSIHAELNLHGLDHTKPSQMSDAFRFGYVAASKPRTNEQLIDELEAILELDLSLVDHTKDIISRLRKLT